METPHKIILGTRGSKLALIQTGLVAEALQKAWPEVVTENSVIQTTGDVNQSPIPLDTIGKAWFTKEIEQALINQKIDLAVHSLKDVSPELPSGLRVIPVLPRADAADVLVSKSGARLQDLRRGAVVGTDSIRRKALILAVRPDLIVRSIRGNLDTRLKKLATEDYDAIVIAAAGLVRLDMQDRVTERFDPTVFIPAPGQGILAVEIKTERTDLLSVIEKIVDAPTVAAAQIEQAFSNAIGGGCKLPVGCYAEIKGEAVSIFAAVGTADGTRVARRMKQGRVAQGIDLAKEFAKEF